ncbi:16751_t:CDS:2, partial [Dentiscutata erythropus]
QQLCNSHYMIIVENEPTHKNSPTVIVENEPISKDKPISNLPNKLSLGDQIKRMTTRTTYDLPTLGEINITSMPAGYSTPFPSSYNGCDRCHQLLSANNNEINDLEEEDGNRLNMNERENLELELQNKINEMNNW